MPLPSQRVICLGRGNVGKTFAAALGAHGVEVELIAGRGTTPVTVQGETVLLAVPDGAIPAVAQRVVGSKSTIVHFAGSLGVAPLESLRASGFRIGVLHPLISIPKVLSPEELLGAALVGTGDASALKLGARWAKTLGMRWVHVEQLDPTRYHAGAALLANGAVALAWQAERLLIQAGVPANQVGAMLGPLLASVAKNLTRSGARKALSGPVARGDANTSMRHLELLRRTKQTSALRAYEGVLGLQLEMTGRDVSSSVDDALLQLLLEKSQ
jgi:predicted short-subunit dehydrogenase-like oxidoreductase (DUF2520 family)